MKVEYDYRSGGGNRNFERGHRTRLTWTLATPGDMPEMCKRQYHKLSSDLLDEHDKWVRNLELDTGPEKYLEWYNAWMDSRHGLYVASLSIEYIVKSTFHDLLCSAP